MAAVEASRVGEASKHLGHERFLALSLDLRIRPSSGSVPGPNGRGSADTTFRSDGGSWISVRPTTGTRREL
jgi:hypothetical protein